MACKRFYFIMLLKGYQKRVTESLDKRFFFFDLYEYLIGYI